MADYYQLKNQNIFNPPANTSLGNTTNQFGNAFVQNDLVLGNVTVTGATIVTPKVSTIGYPGDDTAADPAGGQTITLTGSGFLVGASVLINGSAVGVVSVVSSTTITFTSPANSAGSYVLYVINTDGGTAIAIPGIQYSGVPTWTTAAGSLGSLYETASFNQSVTATGDAPITYSLFSGSIPPGATFNSNGTITGTSQVLSSSTTYTFTVRATDAEAQDTNRSFSLTINPDVVTWSSPANGTTYTSALNSAISNVTLVATSAVGSGITYTANALPVGLSLTGANISGTPTVEANSSSLLTATANTTSESSSITINWAISVANDAYFEYNTLLIPGASTTFVDDASTNNFAVTIFGDTKPNSLNPYTPGYYSNYFDGTGDYLTVPVSTALALSANYTIECWIYPTVAGQKGIYTSIDNTGDPWQGVGFEIYTNNCPRAVGWSGGSSSMDLVHQTSVVLNTWNHIALCRNNNLTYLYLNGVQSTSSSADSTSYAQSGSTIGQQYPGSSQPFTGYISNLRVVKGTAVYTAAFTPPTSPLTAIANTSLLTCQSNSIIDNSTNAFTLTVGGDTSVKSFDPFVPNSSYSTYGSGYFDGTGDFLSIAHNTNLSMTSSDFTAEAWVYFTALPAFHNETIIQKSGKANVSVPNWAIYTGNGYWCYLIGQSGNPGTALLNVQTNATMVVGVWYHVALVKTGTSYSLYLNGISINTSTTASVPADNNPLPCTIGYQTDQGSSSYMTGYISDVRVVNGTAVYTTTFTPPSAPLTAVSGTSLLTLQNNQSVNNSVFLDNSTNNFLVTRAGNTTQGTFSPYGGNWSNYFDGTGDYLSVADSLAFQMGTGDFTLEVWVNPSALSASDARIWSYQGVGGTVLNLYILASGSGSQFAAAIRSHGNTGYTQTNGTTVAKVGTWYHVAFSRSSGTTKLFVNGIQEGSTQTSQTQNIQNATPSIGGYSTGNSEYFSGYISNLRIVKGTAVYTTTFTPATTPLTPITNTSLLTCQSSRFIDNSINNFTLTKAGDTSVQRFSPFNPSSVTPTSYSGYFDGTGDYLTWSGTTVGTGAMTFECWFYYTGSFSGISSFIGPGSAITGGLNCYINDSTSFAFDAYGVTAKYFTVSTITANTWNHVAFVRNSSNVATVFFNGVRSSTGTLSDTYSYTTSAAIGYVGGVVPRNWIGYISNARLVVGSNVYDPAQSTITVPTTPLTAIANTALLTCQSPTFIDNSTNNFTITAFGNSQPTQQNPFGFTSATTEGYTVSTIGGSGYFDGTGDYLSLPINNALAFGLNNFTVELWFYQTATMTTEYEIIEAQTTSAFVIYKIGASGALSTRGYASANDQTLISHANLMINTWYHIAVSRTSGVTKGFVNGVQVFSVADPLTYAQPAVIPTIGARNGGTNSFPGYISDFRVVNGTGLYTSSFVPPSAPVAALQNTTLLTNMTSAGIYDAAMMNNMETVGDAKLSTAVSKFGGSSMYFDGTGDYINGPSLVSLAFGTGDFTIEYWAYPTSGTNNGIFQISDTAGGFKQSAANSLAMNIYTTNSVTIYVNQFNYSTGNNTLPFNTWTHLAIVRSSGVTKLYINGSLVTSIGTAGSITDTTNYSGTYIVIGGYYSTSYLWNGYIDDFRITKGYARYTSNFTAPTSAFPIF